MGMVRCCVYRCVLNVCVYRFFNVIQPGYQNIFWLEASFRASEVAKFSNLRAQGLWNPTDDSWLLIRHLYEQQRVAKTCAFKAKQKPRYILYSHLCHKMVYILRDWLGLCRVLKVFPSKFDPWQSLLPCQPPYVQPKNYISYHKTGQRWSSLRADTSRYGYQVPFILQAMQYTPW